MLAPSFEFPPFPRHDGRRNCVVGAARRARTTRTSAGDPAVGSAHAAPSCLARVRRRERHGPPGSSCRADRRPRCRARCRPQPSAARIRVQPRLKRTDAVITADAVWRRSAAPCGSESISQDRPECAERRRSPALRPCGSSTSGCAGGPPPARPCSARPPLLGQRREDGRRQGVSPASTNSQRSGPSRSSPPRRARARRPRRFSPRFVESATTRVGS